MDLLCHDVSLRYFLIGYRNLLVFQYNVCLNLSFVFYAFGGQDFILYIDNVSHSSHETYASVQFIVLDLFCLLCSESFEYVLFVQTFVFSHLIFNCFKIENKLTSCITYKQIRQCDLKYINGLLEIYS